MDENIDIAELKRDLGATRARAERAEAALAENGGRYWEARYRDEAAALDALREEIEELKKPRQNLDMFRDLDAWRSRAQTAEEDARYLRAQASQSAARVTDLQVKLTKAYDERAKIDARLAAAREALTLIKNLCDNVAEITGTKMLNPVAAHAREGLERSEIKMWAP